MRRTSPAPLVLLAALCTLGSTPRGESIARQAAAPPLVLDVAVVDAAGRPVAGLTADNIEIRVDGQVRPVRALRPSPAAERLLLLVVDEASLPPVAVGSATAIAKALASALPPETRAGLLTLPFAPPKLVVNNDRASLGRDLDQLRGRGSSDQQVARAQEDVRPADRPVGEEEGRRVGSVERLPGETQRAATSETANPAAAWAPLLRVLANLRRTPAPKTVVVFYGVPAGPAAPSSPEMRAMFTSLASTAQASRTALDVVLLPTGGVGGDRPDWADELASATGGVIVDARSDQGAPARLLAPKVSAGFIVEVEAAPGDRDGRPHDVAVSTSLAQAVVHASRRVFPEGAAAAPAAPAPPVATPQPAAPTAAVPPTPPPAATPAAPASPSRAAAPRKPEVSALLEAAARYLAEYANALSSVVAEEEYLQRLNRQLSRVSQLGEGLGSGVDYSVLERRLRSDFLLVRTAETSDWLPFRDVYEVDGKAVRDRQDRLHRLFLDSPGTALQQARRIMTESARYNLGDMARTINIPTLPLLVVDPRHRDRFEWKKAGSQTVEGVKTERLEFDEQATPTLIRSSRGQDVPVLGTLWIDPQTGRVVKGVVKVRKTRREEIEVTVVFRPNEALGVWVPAEMTEFYKIPGQTIDATAKYSNYRRFQVRTEEKIVVPK